MKKSEAIVAIESGKKIGHPHIERDGYFAIMNGQTTYYDGTWIWPTSKSVAELLSSYSENDDRFEVIEEAQYVDSVND